jgi:hypothetical protein
VFLSKPELLVNTFFFIFLTIFKSLKNFKRAFKAAHHAFDEGCIHHFPVFKSMHLLDMHKLSARFYVAALLLPSLQAILVKKAPSWSH